MSQAMHAPNASLQQIYRRRIDVPLLIVIAGGVLALGLMLPVMSVRKLVFYEDTYSVLTGLQQLVEESHYALALVLFIFSVVFPLVKLVMLLFVWFWPQTSARRHGMLHWLGLLGKWSMLDVFVVALIVLISKTSSLLDASPRVGLYVFAVAVGMSMLLTMYVHYLARRVDRHAAMPHNPAPPHPPTAPRDEAT